MRRADAPSTPPRTPLHTLVRDELTALAHADDADVARLTAEIGRRHGDAVAAVLLYGSYLRGKRDTLLDFYVLLDDLADALPTLDAWGNRLLPPNVYYVSLPADGDRPALRAKYATMTLRQFERAMDGFHSYFWSRFTQPAGLVSARSDTVLERIASAVARAVDTFVSRTLPMLPAPFTAPMLWRRGLALTYGCELRAESADGIDDVYRHYAGHFDALLDAYARSPTAAVSAAGDGTFRPAGAAPAAAPETAPAAAAVPMAARLAWGARRVQGKLLSVLRLIKAAATFDDPLDYLLWKIERHSGIYLAPSERQRRHPLIFAWPLLWRLYRRGAFR